VCTEQGNLHVLYRELFGLKMFSKYVNFFRLIQNQCLKLNDILWIDNKFEINGNFLTDQMNDSRNFSKNSQECEKDNGGNQKPD